jgi:putative transposase
MRSDWAISIRRACAAILFDPKTYRYKSRRPDQAALEQRMREICQTRVRFGCESACKIDPLSRGIGVQF